MATSVAGGSGLPALLQLGDGRFPSGGHAHSGGMEAAAAREGIDDLPALERFLQGRLATVGRVAAAFAAASCERFGDAAGLAALDRELRARTPSPALRRASRRLGRQLLRAGRAVWPHRGLDALAASPGDGPYQPVSFGAVAAAASLDPHAAALATAHDAVVSPATAAVRLLGIDPFAVHALIARLGDRIEAVADDAARLAGPEPGELPATASPLLDVAAEEHAGWQTRLFAS
jgi:urease accessory protein